MFDCRMCGKRLPLEQKSKAGRLCRPCDARRRQKHREEKRELEHRRDARRSGKMRRWAKDTVIGGAIKRGEIRKRPCEVCGETPAEAHHDSYFFPLSVRWLCQVHHTEWHDLHGPGKGSDLVAPVRLRRLVPVAVPLFEENRNALLRDGRQMSPNEFWVRALTVFGNVYFVGEKISTVPKTIRSWILGKEVPKDKLLRRLVLDETKVRSVMAFDLVGALREFESPVSSVFERFQKLRQIHENSLPPELTTLDLVSLTKRFGWDAETTST